MLHTEIKSATINSTQVVLWEREDGKFDVTSTCADFDGNDTEEYHAEGVDQLAARVEYANQVLYLAGAN